MVTRRILGHLFIPAASMIKADEAKPTSNDCMCKPSELPIYSPDLPGSKKPEVCIPEKPGAIEETFGKIRRGISSLVAEARALEAMGEDYIQDGIENVECVIEYLQEEDNTTPKYGAVAVGALTGLILGLRGRFFRRTLFASMGALGMAAICYPKEASEYSQIGITEGKRYATIVYNFIYGVKKDDPPLELPSLPKLPGSLSEAWDTAKSLGTSSKSPVTEQVQAEAEKVGPDEESPVDPLAVVSETHSLATHQACHCPVGACMGHHEESQPDTDNDSSVSAQGN